MYPRINKTVYRDFNIKLKKVYKLLRAASQTENSATGKWHLGRFNESNSSGPTYVDQIQADSSRIYIQHSI